MPPSEDLITFFLASAVCACVPGPGVLYAAAHTLAAGGKAGWTAALGFHVAGLGHVLASVVGATARHSATA